MDRSGQFDVLSTLPLKDFLGVVEEEHPAVAVILLFRLNREKVNERLLQRKDYYLLGYDGFYLLL